MPDLPPARSRGSRLSDRMTSARGWRAETMMLRLFLIAYTLLVAGPGPVAGELFVGTGKRVITPDPLLPVSGGLGPTRPVREKRGELTARAVYLRRGEV